MTKKEEKKSIIEICPIRNVVARFGNKWALLVVFILNENGSESLGAVVTFTLQFNLLPSLRVTITVVLPLFRAVTTPLLLTLATLLLVTL